MRCLKENFTVSSEIAPAGSMNWPATPVFCPVSSLRGRSYYLTLYSDKPYADNTQCRSKDSPVFQPSGFSKDSKLMCDMPTTTEELTTEELTTEVVTTEEVEKEEEAAWKTPAIVIASVVGSFLVAGSIGAAVYRIHKKVTNSGTTTSDGVEMAQKTPKGPSDDEASGQSSPLLDAASGSLAEVNTGGEGVPSRDANQLLEIEREKLELKKEKLNVAKSQLEATKEDTEVRKKQVQAQEENTEAVNRHAQAQENMATWFKSLHLQGQAINPNQRAIEGGRPRSEYYSSYGTMPRGGKRGLSETKPLIQEGKQ